MKSKFLVVISLMMMVMFVLAFGSLALGAEADSPHFKIIAFVDEDTLKTKYVPGDDFNVLIKFYNDTEKIGTVTGAFEFDTSCLEVKDLEAISKYNINFFQGLKNESLNTDHTNQVIFWLSSNTNQIGNETVGMIYFKVIKEFEINNNLLSFKNVTESKYDGTSKANVTSIVDFKEEEEPKNNVEKEKDNKTSNQNDSKPSNNSKTNDKTSNKSDDNTITESNIWSKSSSWAEGELKEASDLKLIPETFKNKDFTKNITRKDFAAVAVKLYENLSGKKARIKNATPFIDTSDDYVLKAYELGITQGTAINKFSPENEITREQMAAMLLRAIEKCNYDVSIDLNKVRLFSDDEKMHSWGKNAIYFMSEKGIIKGISTKDNTFGVINNATIEQAVVISLRTVDSYQ